MRGCGPSGEGASPSLDTASGVTLFPLAELLRPLQATAHRCALAWTDPFLIYEANKCSPEVLAEAGRRYAARIASWAGAA